MPCHYNYPMPNVAALGVGARAKQITTMGLADSPIHRVLLRSPPLARVGAMAVVLLARRGRKYATPPLSSLSATAHSLCRQQSWHIHPSIRRGEITPCGRSVRCGRMDVRSVLRGCGSGGKLCDNEYHHIHDFKPS